MSRNALLSVLTISAGVPARPDAGTWCEAWTVRDIVIGPDAPLHKGRIAYRAVFSSALMKDPDIAGRSRTKWWGLDRHIVIYYTTPDRSQVYFVTSVPEPAE